MTSRLRKAAFRHVIASGALVAVTCFSAGIALAQRPQNGASPDASSPDRIACENRQRALAPGVRIAGCTALIESGNLTRSDLAVSFNNRGAAYQEKRDLERAIADYSEAIRLHPTS